MKIQIGNAHIFQIPQKWEDLEPRLLKYIFTLSEADVYKAKLQLFVKLSGVSQQLLRAWETDAGEDFIYELTDVLDQSTAFLFERIENSSNSKLSTMLEPPFKSVGFGGSFQDATFDDFAMIDKSLRDNDLNTIIEVMSKKQRKWKQWQRNAIIHHAISCHGLIIDNLPHSMKTNAPKSKRQNRYGWASVQMELAGEKLGNYSQVKETNIWDILVLLENIDKQNHSNKK